MVVGCEVAQPRTRFLPNPVARSALREAISFRQQKRGIVDELERFSLRKALPGLAISIEIESVSGVLG